MITYDQGSWSIMLLCKLRGSVFPRAFIWALPAAVNAIVIHYLWFDRKWLPEWETGSGLGAIWSSFTFVLGFLIVFRTQSAYSRYWEGATLVQQARASFFNCCSSLIAFTSPDLEKKKCVHDFQHLLVRLMSMLHCVGLQTVAEMADVKFEFFNTDGMEDKYLAFLSNNTDKHQRCEIVIQWIQRAIIENHRNGILDVPAPILTRVFQELAQGASYIIHARNMTGIPFPFPYAQLLTALLIAHWALTPFFIVVVMKSALYSSVFSFISVFAFWGVNYIAAEIESPFGDDPNDLPLHRLQKDMNKSLWILLHPNTQAVPKFEFDPKKHLKWDMICKANFDNPEHDAVKGILTAAGKKRLWASEKHVDKEKNIPFNLNRQGSCESLPSMSMKASNKTGRTSSQSDKTMSVRASEFHVSEWSAAISEAKFVAGEDELPFLFDTQCEKELKADCIRQISAGSDTTQTKSSLRAVAEDHSDFDPSPIPNRSEKSPFDALQNFLQNYITQTVHELLRLEEILRSNRKVVPLTPALKNPHRLPVSSRQASYEGEQGLHQAAVAHSLSEVELFPRQFVSLGMDPPNVFPARPGLRRI